MVGVIPTGTLTKSGYVSDPFPFSSGIREWLIVGWERPGGVGI
jgi:hypothetical protein